jgi:hypothetical protein
MSQRPSGYARQAHDQYFTPAWPTQALIPFLPAAPRHVLEPACGNGGIATPLAAAGYTVTCTDIADPESPLDFLSMTSAACDLIITNPPFDTAREFIEHALDLGVGFVGMLLRIDYDSAKTRRHLFGDCPMFARKVVLTKRIVFFQRPGAAPSFNHAWFIWDRQHQGAPTISYAPEIPLKAGSSPDASGMEIKAS